MGGLRNPNRAVAKSVGLRCVGVKIRFLLEKFVKNNPHVLKIGEAMGSDRAVDFEECDLEECRLTLAEGFGLARPGHLPGYWSELFGALIDESGDPDVDIPDWISSGFPLGIDRPIVPRGVFPINDSDTAAVEQSRAFGSMAAHGDLDKHTNYKSFYDEVEAADADFDRIVEKGFAERVATTHELKMRWGEVRAPKVAVVAKVKRDGTKKVRLIVDMLRSGTNGDIVARERLVLPRMTDLANSVVDLIEQQPLNDKTATCELFAFDFRMLSTP